MVTARGRRPGREREINLAVDQGRAPDAAGLVAPWGLPRDRHPVPADEVGLWFDAFDRAHLGTGADGRRRVRSVS